MSNYPDERNASVIFIKSTKLLWHWLEKYSKYNVPQQFVEMLLFHNKPWLVRYKKIRAMSFLPSVECGKFKLKQAFQSGKILACSKKTWNLRHLYP